MRRFWQYLLLRGKPTRGAFVALVFMGGCLAWNSPDLEFRRRRDHLERIVAAAESALPAGIGPLKRVELPGDLAGEFVLAARGSNWTVVEIHTWRGFPVKHRGFAYLSTEDWERVGWYRQRWSMVKVADNWFRFSD